MASIIRKQTKTGIRYDIQLSPGENESRPKISLGKVTAKQANTAKLNMESLIKCKNTGAVISPLVQEWINGLSDGLRKRLEVLKIIDAIHRTYRYIPNLMIIFALYRSLTLLILFLNIENKQKSTCSVGGHFFLLFY